MSVHRNHRDHPYQSFKSTSSLSRSVSFQESSLIDRKLELLKEHKADIDLQLKSVCYTILEMVKKIESLRTLNQQLFQAKRKLLLKQSKRSKYHHSRSNIMINLSDTSSHPFASVSSSTEPEIPLVNKFELDHLTVSKIDQMQPELINSYIDFLFKETTSNVSVVASKPSIPKTFESRPAKPNLKKRFSCFDMSLHASSTMSTSPPSKRTALSENQPLKNDVSQKKVEIKTPQHDTTGQTFTGGEKYEKIVLKPTATPVHPPVPVEKHVAKLKSPDDLEPVALETMSFANRRNMWERRSLGRSHKFRPPKSTA